MLNAEQLDAVCVFTTITCEFPLNFPVHSITFSLMDNLDYAYSLACRLRFYTVYVINTHRHALEQFSLDSMVRLWLLNVCCTHYGC